MKSDDEGDDDVSDDDASDGIDQSSNENHVAEDQELEGFEMQFSEADDDAGDDDVSDVDSSDGNQQDEAEWNLQYKKLQDYNGKHGHCELFLAVDRFTFSLNTPTNTTAVSLPVLQVKVPKRFEEDQQLANWVQTQRSYFNSCKLDQERKRRLDEICFEFSARKDWNLQFQKLLAYYGKHGHCE
jgi:hypothetical protein